MFPKERNSTSLQVQDVSSTDTSDIFHTVPTVTPPTKPSANEIPSTSGTNGEQKDEKEGDKLVPLTGNNDEEEIDSFLQGWRLQFVNFSMCLGLFLSQLEGTIVSTSLVSITDNLHGFSTSSWIITSYLLTYTGFLIIIAKLSDIFGRKNVTVIVLVFFIAFSIGCGLARGMTTLIILRALQGIGGGGLYAMGFVVLPEMVPLRLYPLYASILSSTMAFANLTGPLVGGAVNHNLNNDNAWRWIFLLNGPAGGIALVLVLLGMPSNFPNHKKEKSRPKSTTFTIKNFQRVDLIGLFLLLGASILFVSALEEGGTQYSWHSAVTLSLLVVSLVLWGIFFFWEWHQEKRETTQESVFPWRLITDRFAGGALLNAFFCGAAWTTVIINLPQKFQVVNGNSPLEAGFRLMALTLATPVGSFVAGILIQRLHIAPIWVMLGCGPLQIIGLILLGFSSSSYHIHHSTYAFQVIMGLGFGCSLGAAIMVIPLVVSKSDMAVGMSGIGQFRALGSSIGIAVCTNVLNKHVSSSLSTVLSRAQLNELLESARVLKELPAELQVTVRHAYAEGYNIQMRILSAFAVAAMLSSLLLWEKTPRKAGQL